MLRPVTGIAALAAIFALLLLRWGGERIPVIGGLLYLPHYIWAFPFVLLGAVAAIVDRRAFLWNLAAVAFVAFGFGDFAWTLRPGVRGRETVVVVTNNIGQSNRASPLPFVEREQPDLVLLQEAGHGGRAMAAHFSGWYRDSQGEFMAASKAPILAAHPVRLNALGGRTAGARYEIAFRGRPCAVYNVHLPTPRRDLQRLFSRDAVEEILDPAGAGDGAGPAGIRRAGGRRIAAGRELAALFAAERLPCLVGGDFNMPGNGYLRRVIGGRLTDAFAARGWGYGFTFPGITGNPLSFFRPWLRLDYLFASPAWRVLYCRVEAGRPSQHRAVVAGFELAAPPR